jgi:thioredoxin reductase (NADPH)
VIGASREAEEDADFLESIGCRVIRMPENGKYEIRGEQKANRVFFRGEEHLADGVFIIKDTVSVTHLVPGLIYENGGIVTQRDMSTSVPGVFAAGDCTGKPFQLSKAVGEGNMAALSACEYLAAMSSR